MQYVLSSLRHYFIFYHSFHLILRRSLRKKKKQAQIEQTYENSLFPKRGNRTAEESIVLLLYLFSGLCVIVNCSVFC